MHSIRKSFNVKDEYYTPKVLVDILQPYIKLWHNNFIKKHKREPIFWCPFDTENSEFCLFLKDNNYKYFYTHIKNNGNFFELNPQFDCAISNPPFSTKFEIFNRLFELKKPFAMIMNMMIINYQNTNTIFADNQIQLLIPNKKISYDGNKSSFASGYFCKDFLPRDLIFCKAEHTNTGKHFVPSRMYGDINE